MCIQESANAVHKNAPPLRAAGAVLVPAPAVERCISRIAILASRFRQPASVGFYLVQVQCAVRVLRVVFRPSYGEIYRV